MLLDSVAHTMLVPTVAPLVELVLQLALLLVLELVLLAALEVELELELPPAPLLVLELALVPPPLLEVELVLEWVLDPPVPGDWVPVAQAPAPSAAIAAAREADARMTKREDWAMAQYRREPGGGKESVTAA